MTNDTSRGASENEDCQSKQEKLPAIRSSKKHFFDTINWNSDANNFFASIKITALHADFLSSSRRITKPEDCLAVLRLINRNIFCSSIFQIKAQHDTARDSSSVAARQRYRLQTFLDRTSSTTNIKKHKLLPGKSNIHSALTLREGKPFMTFACYKYYCSPYFFARIVIRIIFNEAVLHVPDKINLNKNAMVFTQELNICNFILTAVDQYHESG